MKASIILASALLAAVPPLDAKSARALNPLETVAGVSVNVFVGDSIGSIRKDRLFYHDQSRENHFKERLKALTETALRSAGLQVSDDAEDSVSVGIWGHQESLSSGDVANIFLVEVVATDFGFSPESPCEDQQDFTLESKAIGLALSGDLEEVLTSEVLRLVEEMLPK